MEFDRMPVENAEKNLRNSSLTLSESDSLTPFGLLATDLLILHRQVHLETCKLATSFQPLREEALEDWPVEAELKL